jgi:hypothetical protein
MVLIQLLLPASGLAAVDALAPLEAKGAALANACELRDRLLALLSCLLLLFVPYRCRAAGLRGLVAIPAFT